ncbi:hypothetical protein ABZ705_26675 [Streptomyces sp. NPDC006984]|uniref:hypothetical protein n=1 Tax=Streptomyces sp. NPDC006984 TaxID=3155463 RepID=UPI0033C57124
MSASVSVDEVTVVEREVLPDGPRLHRSLPQAHHSHLLWSGGARANESLLPGATGALAGGGARRIPLPTGLVSMSALGWFRPRRLGGHPAPGRRPAQAAGPASRCFSNQWSA